MYAPPSPLGYFPRVLPRGVGATSPIAAGGAVASSAASIGAAAGWISSSVVPFIGPAIAGVSLAIQAIMNSGCGQTCIVSTQFANQAGALMTQNLQAYMALPAPRPYEAQQAALANFDNFWAWLIAPGQCGNPALGSPGQRCISERQRGGVSHWCCAGTEAVPSSLPCNGGPPCCVGCDWFTLLRDPIANDTNVAPAVSSAISSGGSLPAILGSNPSSWPSWWPLAVAGLIVAAVTL